MVEGARLESVYRVKSSIEGSNPSLSANFIRIGLGYLGELSSPKLYMTGSVAAIAAT